MRKMTKGTVIIGVYPKTRKRINVHCATKGMTQPDYLDSLVPPAPGEEVEKAG